MSGPSCPGVGINEYIRANATIKVLEIKQCGAIRSTSGLDSPIAMSLPMPLSDVKPFVRFLTIARAHNQCMPNGPMGYKQNYMKYMLRLEYRTDNIDSDSPRLCGIGASTGIKGVLSEAETLLS